MLSSKGAAEPGPYTTKRTPYLHEIGECLSPSHWAEVVYFQKSAQVGATELGNNFLGHTMDVSPGPFLFVQPSLPLAKRLSKQRIDPMIESTPRLREKVAPARERDSGNTELSKSFPGGVVVIAGANSATGLRSMPARRIVVDEWDAYDDDVDDEGDPLELLDARTQTFGRRRKIFIPSTPLVRGQSKIEDGYESSDKRRYHVPCPHCGSMQWLKFEQLRWEKHRPETARYVCEHCDEPISEAHKTWMLESGEWIATAHPDQIARARRDRVVGFHISGLYSPVGWLSWEDIARKWEKAQGKPSKLKAFKNLVLGETWQPQGDAPDWERIYERRNQRADIGFIPAPGLILTAGADVQRDRIEVDVWAWGRDLQSFLVDHIVLDGDTSKDEVWSDLEDLLNQTWPHECGREMALAKLAIDTGDGKTTDRVYKFSRKVGNQQVYLVKGVGGFDKATPVDGPTYIEVSDQGKKIRRGIRLYKVVVSVFKSELYGQLRLKQPSDEDLAEGKGWPEGYVHLPAGTTEEWVKQLTAEQLVTVKLKSGNHRLEWQQLRERNEALDCRVYARAAAWLIGLDRLTADRWEQLEAQLVPAETPDAPPLSLTTRQSKPATSRPSTYLGGRRPNYWNKNT